MSIHNLNLQIKNLLEDTSSTPYIDDVIYKLVNEFEEHHSYYEDDVEWFLQEQIDKLLREDSVAILCCFEDIKHKHKDLYEKVIEINIEEIENKVAYELSSLKK